MAKSSRRSRRRLILSSMYRLAPTEAFSGLKGERLLANSSEFTNSLQPRSSGSTAYDAVVLPEPLQPDMMKSRGIVLQKY